MASIRCVDLGPKEPSPNKTVSLGQGLIVRERSKMVAYSRTNRHQGEASKSYRVRSCLGGFLLRGATAWATPGRRTWLANFEAHRSNFPALKTILQPQTMRILLYCFEPDHKTISRSRILLQCIEHRIKCRLSFFLACSDSKRLLCQKAFGCVIRFDSYD